MCVSATGFQAGYMPPQPAAVLPDSKQMGGAPYPPVVAAQPQQPDYTVIHVITNGLHLSYRR